MALTRLGTNSITALPSGVVDSAALASGVGGSLVKLSSSTFSSSTASVNYDNTLITSTYDIYAIHMVGVNGTGTPANIIRVRLSADNGSTIRTTGYRSLRRRIYNNVSDGSTLTDQTAYYSDTLLYMSPDADDLQNAVIYIYNPTSSSKKTQGQMIGVFGGADTYQEMSHQAGRYDTAEAHNYISLIPSTDFLSGTIALYGVTT